MPEAGKRSALPQLKVIRELRGLTMRELEARSGVSKTTIYQIERGNRTAQDGTARKLADALGVGVKDLIFPHEQIEAAERQNEEMNARIELQLAALTDEQLAALVHGRMRRRFEHVWALGEPPEEARKPEEAGR